MPEQAASKRDRTNRSRREEHRRHKLGRARSVPRERHSEQASGNRRTEAAVQRSAVRRQRAAVSEQLTRALATKQRSFEILSEQLGEGTSHETTGPRVQKRGK